MVAGSLMRLRGIRAGAQTIGPIWAPIILAHCEIPACLLSPSLCNTLRALSASSKPGKVHRFQPVSVECARMHAHAANSAPNRPNLAHQLAAHSRALELAARTRKLGREARRRLIVAHCHLGASLLLGRRSAPLSHAGPVACPSGARILTLWPAEARTGSRGPTRALPEVQPLHPSARCSFLMIRCAPRSRGFCCARDDDDDPWRGRSSTVVFDVVAFLPTARVAPFPTALSGRLSAARGRFSYSPN